ncbi:MAG: AMP-binding protein [Bacteroidota bacterium]|nr:AMP-binding protein [Bacteroidota bacterium]
MRHLDEDYPLYEVEPFESFAEMLERSSARYHVRTALVDLNQTPLSRLTYGELRRAVLKFGNALRRLGVREGDHVALIGENRVQWGVAYLAITTFNAVAVPIDRNLRENEILTILHASDSVAAVFSEGFRQMFEGFRHALKDLRLLVDMDLPARRDGIESMTELLAEEERGTPPDRFPNTQPERLAVLVFTSGSMGSAKGVMLSQKNITSNIVAMRRMIELPCDDRFFSVLPIHHTYECTCGFLCPLSAGASVYYARSLKTITEDILVARPTILLGVPLLYDKMYRRIAQAIEEKPVAALLMKPIGTVVGLLESVGAKALRRKVFREIHRRLGGNIRILIVGGAAPEPATARGFRAFGFPFLQGYGLTETSPILALNRLRKFRDDAAGLPLPNVEVRIDRPDEDGVGEILARGPSVMLGYYKNEQGTREVLDDDGWFRTGDLGYFDAAGFLHIKGRKKNVIIAKNGKNVYPEEIEELVNKLPSVLECVVYGVPEEKGGEEITVKVVPYAEYFVELAEKQNIRMTEAFIRETVERDIRKLNDTLPIHKRIRRIVIKEEEFEKTTTQKIKRHLVERG